ncbi:hypothetical protein [Massilia antarctica]|uniref:hypothetical protein n=1 Tax=Massilia antarctica TaxID=2765360 RepID=UPI0035A609A4
MAQAGPADAVVGAADPYAREKFAMGFVGDQPRAAGPVAGRIAVAALAGAAEQYAVAARHDVQVGIAERRQGRAVRRRQLLARKMPRMGVKIGMDSAIGQPDALQHGDAGLVDDTVAPGQAQAHQVEGRCRGPVEQVAAERVATAAVRIGRPGGRKIPVALIQVGPAHGARVRPGRVLVAQARIEVAGIVKPIRVLATVSRAGILERERQVEQQIGRQLAGRAEHAVGQHQGRRGPCQAGATNEHECQQMAHAGAQRLHGASSGASLR